MIAYLHQAIQIGVICIKSLTIVRRNTKRHNLQIH